jgi:hypothetical protein
MERPQPKTSAQRHAEWYARNHDKALEMKRKYYHEHPDYKAKKNAQALAKYYATKVSV